MDPLTIVLVVLVVAAVWAVIELALTIRKTRGVVDSLDKTVGDLNNTLAEAQPIVAKLDGAVDELMPALGQVEPLLASSKTAVDALTSNLVEIEGVVRDISSVTGSMADASNAVSSVTDSAAGAVQKLIDKVKAPAADAGRKLAAAREELEEGAAPLKRTVVSDGAEADTAEPEPEPRKYFTYDSTADSKEGSDE